jgi:DNA-binding transcriptional LysR family regulator
MHRRYDSINIPTEILRTLIVVQESGSFTKAADQLGVSQPAISTQMKRLQQIVGGNVFHGGSASPLLTEKGKRIAQKARRILRLNDLLVSLAGGGSHRHMLKVGIPNPYSLSMIEKLMRTNRDADPMMQFVCDSSANLATRLASGYLDIAFILTTPAPQLRPQRVWTERLAWICAEDFKLEPGAVLPLQSWPRTPSDEMAIRSCEANELLYSFVFEATDLGSHLTALRSGAGLLILPERSVPSGLRIAQDGVLPELPSVSAGIYLHADAEASELQPAVDRLAEVMAPAA